MSPPKPYDLPEKENALRGGCATSDGILAWYRDRAYTWKGPEEGWHALALAPFPIGSGFAAPQGVLVVGKKEANMGFWEYGARDWAWFEDLPFPQITLPIGTPAVGGWLLGSVPEEEGSKSAQPSKHAQGSKRALLRYGEEGIQWVDSVPAPSSPVVCWVEDASPRAIEDSASEGVNPRGTNSQGASSRGASSQSASSQGASSQGADSQTLYVVGDEIWRYEIPSGFDSSGSRPPGSPSLTERQEVGTVRRRPPGYFKIDLSHPPQVVGGALFVHYHHRGSIRIDLREGTVHPLGVAPVSKSDVLWRVLEKQVSGEKQVLGKGDLEAVARVIDTADALPPASLIRERAGISTEIIDAHVESDGTVRSVLTREGMLPEPDVPAIPNASQMSSSDETYEEEIAPGAKRHATEAWGLWLGRHSAEIDMCHALCTSRSRQVQPIDPSAEGEFLVESLLEQIGVGALGRLVEILRESSPPEESGRAGLTYDYSGVGLRQLAAACGPDASTAVERALTEGPVPVRVAACWAAGATQSPQETAKLGEINSNESDSNGSGKSALWPDQASVPREAIISNLREPPPSLQVAAADTCARLDLTDSARPLTFLLEETPLMEGRHVILRRTALKALQTLSGVPDATWEKVGHLARSDPSKGVRAAATAALGAESSPDLPDVLAQGVGDVPEVGQAAVAALPQCAGALSLSSFRDLVDRWLLRIIGASRAVSQPGEIRSASDSLLVDVLCGRLLHENGLKEERLPGGQADSSGITPTDIMSAVEADLEDLSASREWFEMASWGLSVQSTCRALAENDGEEPTSKSFEVVAAAFERMQEIALADEDARVVTAAHGTEEDDIPQRAIAACNRSPQLGRRLAALVYHSLEGDQEHAASSTQSSAHRPLHERLRSVPSGPTPRERLRRALWELTQEDGVGGALGLYVLAIDGETRAEAHLINRLVGGDLSESPLIWTLLTKTRPFSSRADAFFEHTLDVYLASEAAPLWQRWAAFQGTFSWSELRGRIAADAQPAVRNSTWRAFFGDCVGAEDLLQWEDRHEAALHLAYRCGEPRRLESLWREKASSVEDVPEDEKYAYARDMLWAGPEVWTGDEDLWPELWARWPDEADPWGLRMLKVRGDMEAAHRIEAALRKEAVPEREAEYVIECIRRRSSS